MSKTDTREILIEAGLNALLQGSYDGVGIGPILKAAGVPKGSFYHFFESKEAFAGAVVETYAERHRRERAVFLADGARPPLERLRRYFEHLERQFAAEAPVGGCLIGNLAQSIAGRSDLLRGELVRAFGGWQRDMRGVLREARDDGTLAQELDPEEAAAFLIDAYEGALIRMKTDGTVEPLKRFVRLMFDRLLVG